MQIEYLHRIPNTEQGSGVILTKLPRAMRQMRQNTGILNGDVKWGSYLKWLGWCTVFPKIGSSLIATEIIIPRS